MSRLRMPKLISLIYVHNPFYLISACLFVWGLKLLFRAGDSSVWFQRGAVGYIDPWGLLTSFAAVTVLMAVTAVLIVRCGKVWEDARSLILIVLLMLLAISISLDELLNVLADQPDVVRRLGFVIMAGTAFALGVCELLVRGLRIRLSAGYRLPLYGFLVLFFAWPVLLVREITMLDAEQTRWLIAAFPLVAGVLTLTLIPAIQNGSAAVRNNGTPWGWPLFPWTPFVFIALAVCFRAYSLTMSFDPLVSGHYWDTTFGVYQLVPFLLAVLIVLLKIGIVEKLPRLQRGVMLVAPSLLLLAYPWLVPWSRLPGYAAFAHAMVNDLASPVFLTLIGLIAMYLWAWWKGVRYAETGLFGMLLLTTFVGPFSFGYRDWVLEPQTWWPILILAGIQVAMGIRTGRSLRAFVGLLLAAFVLCRIAPKVEQFTDWPGFLAVHAFLAIVLFVGLVFRDAFAEVLRQLSAPLVSFTALVGLILLAQNDFPALYVAAYGLAMTVMPLGLRVITNDRRYAVVAIMHAAVGSAVAIVMGIEAFFRVSLTAGVKPVILAISSFVIAVFISILKSGLGRRLRMYWLTRHRRTTS